MRIKRVILITCITLTALSSAACGSTKTTTSQSNSGIQYDYVTIEDECMKFISGTDTTELPNFEQDVELDSNDITTSTDSALKYASNSAVYIQIARYMYRFQLNSDGKVQSYIKYSVEA
jgi:hypothetical protein